MKYAFGSLIKGFVYGFDVNRNNETMNVVFRGIFYICTIGE
jgi:hypothetical protein